MKKFNSKNDIFAFGKHKGKSLLDVYNTDREYINWCLNNIEGFTLSETICKELNLNNKRSSRDDTSEQLESDLTSILYEARDAKLKLDLLKRLYEDILKEKPQKADIFSIHIHNYWNTGRWLIDRDIQLLEEELQGYKHSITILLKGVTEFVENRLHYEYISESEYKRDEISITITKNENLPKKGDHCNIIMKDGFTEFYDLSF